jgi:hypothetical protein
MLLKLLSNSGSKLLSFELCAVSESGEVYGRERHIAKVIVGRWLRLSILFKKGLSSIVKRKAAS